MDGYSDIDRVRDASDLAALIGEHVALKPRGREHVGLCPFHDDHSPSFTVVTHKAHAFYKCHACGASGDVFTFVMQFFRMEFPEALRFLADRAGVQLSSRGEARRGGGDGGNSREDLLSANAFAEEFFGQTLLDPRLGEPGRAVLRERGIDDTLVEQFKIGFAPDGWDGLLRAASSRGINEPLLRAAGLAKPRTNGSGSYDVFRYRLVFPIHDELGRPIAFGGRKVRDEDRPKYLNSPGTRLFAKSKTLYALHLAKRSIIEAGRVVVTEGYTDVIACHRAGVTNAVATLGTALTRDHAKLLSRLCDTVVLVFDGDAAGQEASDSAIEVFMREPIDVKICILPDGADPDELLSAPGGRERFEEAIEQAADALEFKLRRFAAELAPITSPAGRQKRLDSLLQELVALGFGNLQGVRKRYALAQLSDLLGLSLGEIERALAATGRSRPERGRADETTTPPARVMLDDVSTARRRAERELLALLVYAPDLAEDAATPIVAELFQSHVHRVIGDLVITGIRNAQVRPVQELLHQLEDEAARDLAASLYFQGESLAERPDALPSALAALDACREQDACSAQLREFRNQTGDGPDAVTAASKLIAALRERGHDPTAIPRGVRS